MHSQIHLHQDFDLNAFSLAYCAMHMFFIVTCTLKYSLGVATTLREGVLWIQNSGEGNGKSLHYLSPRSHSKITDNKESVKSHDCLCCEGT